MQTTAPTTTGAITHISIVTVHVSDQDAALDFYVNVLGFEKRMDERFGENGENFRWLTVAPRGAQTQIVLAANFADGSGTPVGGSTGMVFETADIQATYQELSARGVRFTEVPTAQPWGMMQAQFLDGDGNHYVLVQTVSR